MLAQRTAWQRLVQLVMTLAFILSIITPVSASPQENAISNSESTESTTQSAVPVDATGYIQPPQTQAPYTFGLPWTIGQTGSANSTAWAVAGEEVLPEENPVDVNNTIRMPPVDIAASTYPSVTIGSGVITLIVELKAMETVTEVALVITLLPGLEPAETMPDGTAWDAKTRILSWKAAKLEMGTALVVKLPIMVSETASDLSVMQVRLTASGWNGTSLAETEVVRLSPAMRVSITPEAGGTLSSTDGRVKLVFAAGTVKEPLTLEYRPLAVRRLQNGIPGQALEFELIATTAEGKQVTQFDMPYELRVETQGLVDIDSLGFTEFVYLGYWDEVKGEHQNLAYELDGSTLVAQVDHFTKFDFGLGETYTAGWVLSAPEASVSTFDGGLSYDYGLNVPSGRGGLTPDLALHYNSRSMDGILNWGQSDWAGYGWTLDTMEIVRKIRPDWEYVGGRPKWGWNFYVSIYNEFTLLYHGTSYKLKKKDNSAYAYGQYYVEDEQFLYIERRNACSGNGSTVNTTGEYWIVKLRDGTEYRLGYKTESEQVIQTQYYHPGTPINCTEQYYFGSPNAWEHVAYRWRVDLVTDTSGNQIEYSYTEEVVEQTVNHDHASYLTDVYYNKLANGTWGSRIHFNTLTRNISPDIVDDSKGGRWWFFYQTYFLSSVQIMTRNGSNYDTIREYKFGYSKRDRSDGDSRLLTSVIEYGSGGATSGSPLPTITFAYSEKANKGWNVDQQTDPWEREQFPYDRLQSIANGYGGQITLDYSTPDGSDQHNWWQAWNYRVEWQSTSDATYGGGGGSKTIYAYPTSNSDLCYENDNGTHGCKFFGESVVQTGGNLIGYRWVSETLQTLSGITVAMTLHQNALDTEANPKHYRGKEYRTTYYNSIGTALKKNDYSWQVMDLSREQGPSNLTYTIYFVYLDNEAAFTAVAGAFSATAQLSTTYQYAENRQGGGQYGNTTHKTTYLDGVARYRENYGYYPNATSWIVNLVGWDGQEDLTSGLWLTKDRYYYDGNADYGNQPIRGLLTRQDKSSAAVGGTDIWITVQSISYDANHYYLPTQIVEGSTNTKTIGYDTNRLYVTSQTNALGYTNQYTYTTSGLLSSQYNANGVTTTVSYVYDTWGRLYKEIRPGDTVTYPSVLYDYSDTNQPLRIRTSQRYTAGQSGVLATDRYYNGLGQLLQEQRHNTTPTESTIVNYEYNAQGQQVTAYMPYTASYSYGYRTPVTSQPAVRTTYDALGRTVLVTNTDGTTVTTFYDGLEKIVQDGKGHQTRYTNDGLGRLTMVREYTGTYTAQNRWTATAYATTTYTYDGRGLLTGLEDAISNTTSIVYDMLGRKTVMTDTDMGTWQYEYDIYGNLSAQTDAKQQRTCLYYDITSRLTAKVYKNDGWGGCPILGERDTSTPQIITPTADMTYTQFLVLVSNSNVSPVDVYYSYDNATGGNLGVGYRTGMSSTVDGITITVTAKVDNRGRTISETRVISGVTYNTRWSYNDRDQVATQTYPNGEVVTTTYDLYSRPDGLMVGATTYITRATYDPADQLLNLPWSVTGAHTTYSYYPWSTMGGRLQRIQSGSSSGVHDYQNLTYQYDAVGNVAAITDTLNSGQVQSFGYDGLDRLISASTSAAGQGQYSHTWTYGKTGNILSDGHTFSYDDPAHPHAVSSVVSGASYVYDLNGNATTITPTTGAARLLDYDYENRLISTAGAVTMQLSYDGDGQRVLKQDGSTVTRYIGAWSEISVTAGTTTTTNYYWFAGRRVAMKVGGAVTYLFADQLGSTVKTTGNQTTVERYEPYGLKRGADTVSTPYRYTGQREEEMLGLYDYGARWYDPSIGRFIQADTIVPQPGNPQSLNRYSYALNNPIRYNDPTGHYPWSETTQPIWYDVFRNIYGIMPEPDLVEFFGAAMEAMYHSSGTDYSYNSACKDFWTIEYNLDASGLKPYMSSAAQPPLASIIEGAQATFATVKAALLGGSDAINTNTGWDMETTDYGFLPYAGTPAMTTGNLVAINPTIKTSNSMLAEEYYHVLQQRADPNFFRDYVDALRVSRQTGQGVHEISQAEKAAGHFAKFAGPIYDRNPFVIRCWELQYPR